MISNFSLELPRHILFGAGLRERLFQIISEDGYVRVLIITGSHWFKESGWQKKFEKQFVSCTSYFLPCPAGEPDIATIKLILAEIRKYKPDLVVAIGGGSVIDTAKACSALALQKAPVEDFLEGIGKGILIKKPGLPLIAMPTTAGTGAEATKNAVIKSGKHQVKKSIRSPYLIPSCIIVDPELALDLSVIQTGIAGMDALVQLFEAYVSRKARPVPQALIKQAFPLMLQALETLADSSRNLEARTDAAYGAMISGIALANSGLGAVHGFASALGGATAIPHGLICAIFFLPVLEANAAVIAQGIHDLLIPVRTIPPEELLSNFKTKITRLLSSFKLDKEWLRYSFKRKLISEIARKATGSSMSGNPRDLSHQEREEIALKALGPILGD